MDYVNGFRAFSADWLEVVKRYSVTVHRAKIETGLQQTNVHDFTQPPNWPPNSSTLNHMDYSVLGHSTATGILSEDQGH